MALGCGLKRRLFEGGLHKNVVVKVMACAGCIFLDIG